ncbi:MAG TPA: hypothetical protein VKS21_07990, partial [Spirochaetota bacterium]|nr:hypothetical protein [Spirochaetota bacterium]
PGNETSGDGFTGASTVYDTTGRQEIERDINVDNDFGLGVKYRPLDNLILNLGFELTSGNNNIDLRYVNISSKLLF